MEQPTNIHEALSEAKKQIGTIGKDDTNEQQGYAFRGIDSIVNRVGPIFAELGIVVSPVHKLISSDEVLSSRSTKGYRVVIETLWTFSISTEFTHLPDKAEKFTVPATSSISAQTLGESIDYSDKAINQAQTQSFKNALAQVLTIPTGEADPDTHSPEVVQELTPKQKVASLLLETMSKSQIRKYATEAMGSLGLEDPIPEESIEDVADEAKRLRDEAEAPLEDDDEEEEDGPEGSYGS